jgi:hypothetical protein
VETSEPPTTFEPAVQNYVGSDLARSTRLEPVDELEFLRLLLGRARLLFRQGGKSPTIIMSKALPVYSDLELPMIVHSGSNRPYFAQSVHSGRKNERLRQRRI